MKHVSDNNALTFVQHMSDAMKFFEDGSRVVYDFLLKHGSEFHGTPWKEFHSRYRKDIPQLCFANSWELALQSPNLTYYEGYAWSGVIPVHHAWCVDERGRVVDVTWRRTVQKVLPENEWEYFGVGFNVEILAGWMKSKDTAGVLFDLDWRWPEGLEQFVVPLSASQAIRRARDAYEARELREGKPVQSFLEIEA